MDSTPIIPDPGRQVPGTQSIPQMAAELPQTEEDPEVLPFKISFARYKPKECQMDSMTGNNAKAVLTILRDVGVHFTDEKNYWNNANEVEIKHVVRDGNYTAFYRGLEEDVEIKEIKYKKENKEIDIRLFFSVLEKERTFYPIAARETHIDTSKGDFRRKFKKRSF